MKFLERFILLFCSSCLVTSAFAWGSEGHETIGALASGFIDGTPAAKHVHALLGDENLATASIWADVVKGHRDQTPEMLQFKAANPNHPVHHYTDIPFEDTEYSDTSVGASPLDVVHAIPACILILQGKADQQHVLTNVPPRVALRLLVHYIEDLHQPLHAGSGYLHGTNFIEPNGYKGTYKDDQGGNRLDFGGTNGLHFFWDVTVVRMAMTNEKAKTPAEFAAKLANKPAPFWKDSGPLLNWDRQWAKESILLSAQVHDVTVMDEDDSEQDFRTGAPRPKWHIKDLTPDYVHWATDTAEQQMIKAGYHVAETLEAIWPN